MMRTVAGVARLAWVRLAAAGISLVVAAGCSGSTAAPAVEAPAAAAGRAAQLNAPLPSPLVDALGMGAANPAHLFVSREWDFARMRQAFNAVNLSPGDQSAVDAARAAGLAVILELDWKTDFTAGQDISARVQAVVDQVAAHPGTISAIHVADRLNEKLSGEQGLAYLAATGGVFHAQLPGVPVFADVSNWELTCGQPRQPPCTSTVLRTTYQYETNEVLTAFVRSGYVDGLFIADNLQQLDAGAQAQAWRTARALWPAPFLLVSRSSQFSFPDDAYPGTRADADAIAAAYITAPMAGGADGVSHWAWRQLYQGRISSLLNKDGSPNPVWDALVAGGASLGVTPRAG